MHTHIVDGQCFAFGGDLETPAAHVRWARMAAVAQGAASATTFPGSQRSACPCAFATADYCEGLSPANLPRGPQDAGGAHGTAAAAALGHSYSADHDGASSQHGASVRHVRAAVAAILPIHHLSFISGREDIPGALRESCCN